MPVHTENLLAGAGYFSPVKPDAHYKITKIQDEGRFVKIQVIEYWNFTVGFRKPRAEHNFSDISLPLHLLNVHPRWDETEAIVSFSLHVSPENYRDQCASVAAISKQLVNTVYPRDRIKGTSTEIFLQSKGCAGKTVQHFPRHTRNISESCSFQCSGHQNANGMSKMECKVNSCQNTF